MLETWNTAFRFKRWQLDENDFAMHPGLQMKPKMLENDWLQILTGWYWLPSTHVF